MKPLEFEQPIVELEEQISKLKQDSLEKEIDMSDEITTMEEKLVQTREEIYNNLTSWQRVQIARHLNRPYMLDYITHGFTEFVELHGDRHIGDDLSMPGGFAMLGDQKVVVIGHQKGRDTKENLMRNFGSAHPEGYRKAIRLMRLAEKFKLPVVTLIDTPGAFPGIGAEERNIAEAIGYNLREMMLLKTPLVAVVLGEGGSGGALGIGVTDRVLMMENAYYSVISPEGCAAILWKHRQHAPEAAEAMKIAAPDLNKLELIDEVIAEPKGGAHQNHKISATNLKTAVLKHIKELQSMKTEQMLEARYEKFRAYGQWHGE